jgi:hypothetical protein
MDQSPLEQSLDKLFEGLTVNEASAVTNARCLVELAYFETRAKGQNFKRKLRPTVLSRVMHCVALQSSEIPPLFTKLTGDELSRFGQKIISAKEIEFKYYQDGITSASLPLPIFCRETKRRIFRFLADPLKNQIEWARQSGMVDSKRLETYFDILRILARHCESLDCLKKDDEVASLRASLDSIKSKCKTIKEQLQQLAPSQDSTGLENKLRKAQGEAAQLSAQIQKHHEPPKTLKAGCGAIAL